MLLPVLGIFPVEDEHRFVNNFFIFSQCPGENTFHQVTHPTAYKIPIRIHRVRFESFTLKHLITCIGQILQRIKKSAIKVKKNGLIGHISQFLLSINVLI